MRAGWWSASAALAVMVACSSPTDDGLICTDQFVYGIHVVATDSITGAPVSSGLTGTVREGSFSEPMMTFDSLLFGAGERQGVYQVDVAAAGYADWTGGPVTVDHDGCHVVPVNLTARLMPSSP